MKMNDFYYWSDDREYKRKIPLSQMECLPGLKWGDPAELFTPAYWLSQYWMAGLDKQEKSPYTSSSCIAEELTFCLLGGFGIKVELATAVYENCIKNELVANLDSNFDHWNLVLSQPVLVNGKKQKYRYPNQKAKYLAGAMQYLRENDLSSLSGIELRNHLLKINGIGPKTAGWISRNITDSDEVAILDIHLVRAGVLSGFFDSNKSVEKDYFELERNFIEFCNAIGVRPASLDCLIWDQMRSLGKVALDLYKKIENRRVVNKRVTQIKQLPLSNVCL
jgi:N-glycosylase/DNA lyase